MADYTEGQIKHDLSLYENDFQDRPSFKVPIDDMNHCLGGNGDSGPLRAFASVSGNDSPAMKHFDYWILENREPRAVVLDLAQRMKNLMMFAQELEFSANPDYLTPHLGTMAKPFSN